MPFPVAARIPSFAEKQKQQATKNPLAFAKRACRATRFSSIC
jgi:hypothetical protein